MCLRAHRALIVTLLLRISLLSVCWSSFRGDGRRDRSDRGDDRSGRRDREPERGGYDRRDGRDEESGGGRRRVPVGELGGPGLVASRANSHGIS